MINISFMRSAPDRFRDLVLKKDPLYDVEMLLKLDKRLCSLIQTIDSLRQKRNELARHKTGETITPEHKDYARELNRQLKAQEDELVQVEEAWKAASMTCPNLPEEDVPAGGKEANRVIRTYGEKKSFSFQPKHHVELNEQVDWFDLEIGAKIAGSQFVFYQEEGASLVYSLALLMMQHNRRHGFKLVLPPVVVNKRSLQCANQLPKFEGAMYEAPLDQLYLSPTSEVGLTNVYRGHIFAESELPVRMTSWTSCFRREAGTYGASERGLIRIHQFEKVELYSLCSPEQADAEHERMIACAEELLQLLGLHYRVSLLAAQDASFQASRTYDIEVWMPGQESYKEVSSASLCTDFQAREANIKYRKSVDGKTDYLYTLNTSSLALPRLMVALMETYQQEDGTIALPPILDSITWTRRG